MRPRPVPDAVAEANRNTLERARHALEAANEVHHRRHDAPAEYLDALVDLERRLTAVRYDFEHRHARYARPLDQLAGRIAADAAASILDVRLREHATKAHNPRRYDHARLPLMAAGNALDLTAYALDATATSERDEA